MKIKGGKEASSSRPKKARLDNASEGTPKSSVAKTKSQHSDGDRKSSKSRNVKRKTKVDSSAKENNQKLSVKKATVFKKTRKSITPVGRKEKKELVEERKKKRKKNYDLEKEAVIAWEKMRKRDIKQEDRARLVSEILEKMKGKMLEMAVSHVASRVLQSCIKHCQTKERDAVFDELRPHLLDLARNTYACHLAEKMITHANKEQFQQMLASLRGNVVKLLRHPSGSAVMEHAYKIAKASEKHDLVSEFFSPEYRLFKGIEKKGNGRLIDILAGEPPSKRMSILEHMTLCLQPILEKGIVDHSIIHRALVEYLSISTKAIIDDIVQQLSGPLLVRMIHTRDGARVGIMCICHGSAKERRKIIKGIKTHVSRISQDDYGYMFLLSILRVVDDTKLVNKIIMPELANQLKDLCLHKYGHRLVLCLLAPCTQRYFPQDVQKLLQSPIDFYQECNSRNNDATDTEIVAKEPAISPEKNGQDAVVEEGKEVCKDVSKKDPLVRRMELLRDSGFAQKLVNVCVDHAGELLRSPCGKDIIYEVAAGGSDGILWKVAPDEITSVHRAIADLAALPQASDKDGQQSDEHVLEQYHASRTIRRLILESHVPVGQSFQQIIWETAFMGRCRVWAQGHGEKVVAALMECADSHVKDLAKAEMQPLIDSGLLQKKEKQK